MTLVRLIAPQWLVEKEPSTKRVIERVLSAEDIKRFNKLGYNVYYLPNSPSALPEGRPVDGTDIDTFDCCFVDMDLKDEVYKTKDEFIEAIATAGLPPTRIVDSGNGVHVYWRVTDLDAMSYLRFQYRLIRLFDTDESLGTLYQLMRLPGTLNTKREGAFALCETLFEDHVSYTAEELNRLLPPITIEDEAKCVQHYEKTHNPNRSSITITDVMPPKFGKLLAESHEAKALWSDSSSDRSKADYRLGHLMFASGFSREEAITVLANSAKALQRAPVHRLSYGENIVDKIWTFEESPERVVLSPTVRDLLSKGDDTIKGTRFPCHKLLDDTVHGFRLGQVIGIIGGSGVGKTTLTLNTFLWFAQHNPDFHHFFFSLEQPAGEIASRIRTICGANDSLYDKIHIVSNYAEDDSFKNFSIDSIQEHLLSFQKETGCKIGATVIDHIGVLDKQTKNGEGEGLIGVCRQMKTLAVKVNTILIMLSQAPREKAGIGDLELDKSAAYGTVFFESFCDYCLCLWQPLKRAYPRGAPTVMAFKFAKIRHKKQGRDRIQEDVCYQVYFDPETERLREMTQAEETAAQFYVGVATNLRKADKKTDIVPYQSRRVEEVSSAPAAVQTAKTKANDNRH